MPSIVREGDPQGLNYALSQFGHPPQIKHFQDDYFFLSNAPSR